MAALAIVNHETVEKICPYLDGGPRMDSLVETEGKKAPSMSIPDLDYQSRSLAFVHFDAGSAQHWACSHPSTCWH